jgi:hypothetical protein
MITLSDFSGGLWNPDQTEFALPSNALLLASNLDFLTTGGLRGRRGRVKYNATVLPGAVLSLFRHYPRVGSAATLAAFVNGGSVEIRHDTIGNGTFSPITGGTGFAAGQRFFFATWPTKNNTFLANGVDTMRSYNGVLSDMGATPPKGPYLTVWQSRLWATRPDEINYSVYASDVNDETVWPADNHLQVADPQGGKIVGLVGWQDRLIILKTTGLFSFFGDIDLPVSSNLQQFSDRGCVSDLSIATCPDGILYMGREGVLLTDGQRAVPYEVSRPIRSTFVSASTQQVASQAFGVWYPRRAQYWLSTTAGVWPLVIATRLLKDKPTWAWATNPLAPNCGCTWDSEGEDGRLLLGDTAGRVWVMDTGTTDDGAPITTVVKLISRLIDPGLSRFGRITAVKALHRGATPIVGSIEYDSSGLPDVNFSVGGTPLGVKDSRATLFDDLSKLGRFMAVGLNTTGDSYNFELHRLDLETRLKAARRWP